MECVPFATIRDHKNMENSFYKLIFANYGRLWAGSIKRYQEEIMNFLRKQVTFPFIKGYMIKPIIVLVICLILDHQNFE